MNKKCGRCHKESNKLISMGSTKENAMMVCPSCHDYWINHYIRLLDKLIDSNFYWKERSAKWEEMYAKFRGKITPEKVNFT